MSTSAPCALAYGASAAPATGALGSVAVPLGGRTVLFTFLARHPWVASAVLRGGGLRWEFTERIPHCRPLVNDNHGGTDSPAVTRLVARRTAASQNVYFRAAGRRITGSHWFSPKRLVLTFPARRFAGLGVSTPFNWVGSEGYDTCAVGTER